MVATTRRDILEAMGVGAAWALARPEGSGVEDVKKTHLVRLSFDDGFYRSPQPLLGLEHAH